MNREFVELRALRLRGNAQKESANVDEWSTHGSDTRTKNTTNRYKLSTNKYKLIFKQSIKIKRRAITYLCSF